MSNPSVKCVGYPEKGSCDFDADSNMPEPSMCEDCYDSLVDASEKYHDELNRRMFAYPEEDPEYAEHHAKWRDVR